MAIIFEKKEEGQKSLIFIFSFLTLIIGIIIWFGFFREKPRDEYKKYPILEIINLDILKKPVLDDLKLFYEIEPFKQKIGRRAPFILFIKENIKERIEDSLENQEVILNDIILENQAEDQEIIPENIIPE